MGGLLEGIATGVASSIGADAAKAAASEGAAAYAGSVEHELDVVDDRRPVSAGLWSDSNMRLAEVAGIEGAQAKIVATLLTARDTELERILEQLRANQFETYVQPYWFAAGDSVVQRQFPELPGDGAGWTLDGFLAYTDPAAGGDANVLVTCTGILAIPFRVVATRNNPARVLIELPVGQASAQQFQFAVTPGAGGAAGDRVGVLARFKRGG